MYNKIILTDVKRCYQQYQSVYALERHPQAAAQRIARAYVMSDMCYYKQGIVETQTYVVCIIAYKGSFLSLYTTCTDCIKRKVLCDHAMHQ